MFLAIRERTEATLPPCVSRFSRQFAILNISQPYRPPRPVMGMDFSKLLLEKRENTSCCHWNDMCPTQNNNTIVTAEVLRATTSAMCGRSLPTFGRNVLNMKAPSFCKRSIMFCRIVLHHISGIFTNVHV
jgi:hypothetical protein